LKLSQRIDTTLAYATVASFDSTILDGRISLKIPDVSDFDEVTQSRPDTWSLCFQPLSGITIRTGSVTYTGLPARANNAVFSVASPFHAPLEINSTSTISAGTSRKTGIVAAEIGSGIWKIAAFTALPDDPGEVSWITCSSTWQSFSERDQMLSLALFSGTRKTKERTDESWNISIPDIPESPLVVSGGECVFRLKEIGGSATFFTNTGAARSIKGMGRGEFYIDSGPILITTGFYRADREYLELDGSSPSVLSRFYASPQVTVETGRNKTTKIQTGGIFCYDTCPGEKYWYDNRTLQSGGCGISIDSKPVDASSSYMATSDTMTIKSSLKINKLFIHSLSTVFSNIVSWQEPRTTSMTPETVKPHATIGYSPVDSRYMKLRITFTYDGKILPADASVSNVFGTSFEGSFPGSRCSTKFCLGASYDVTASKPAGFLSGSIDIR
jgi:hypothetical protein